MTKRTILIVDDNKINKLILFNTLKDDYQLIEASDGDEALKILDEKHDSISAVLLDIVMPVLDGYGVLDAMHKDSRLSQIPVIIISGNSDIDSEVKALTLGANDFVIKPFNADIIRQRLKNVISLRENAATLNATHIDPLTGLYSRAAFLEKAEELIAQKEAGYYVMACFDIDNFKVINDKYGSAKGDQLLRFIADTFIKGFEGVGAICCRITADNFAVLYPYSFIATEKITEIIKKAAAFDGSIQTINLSIGRYIVKDLTLSARAMYDRATIAQATIKKSHYGIKIAQYDESMREAIIKEQDIINEMHGALKTRQFQIWLQPQYNHSSGAIIGSEALVRWLHPEKGMIPPYQFISVFESNGFIYEMDKYVWEECCILLRKWLDANTNPLPISVNVSRFDILSEDFFETITGLVQKYNIPPEYLRLEITESAFSKSADQIISVVKRVIDYGFTVEIDDFGSGYSSLNTLKEVPANILKLDMRFLESNGDTARGGNILESIVRMAKWLGMPVIAEGVETKKQADYLLSIGCFYVQGYLYAKPMPIEQFEQLFADSPQRENSMNTLETVDALDYNSFWNPESMETLIFNSYVGGSCILEFHNGSLELLRANKKYAQELGGNDMTLEDALKINLQQHMDMHHNSLLLDTIVKAIESDKESSCELCLTGLPNKASETYLRTSIRVIAKAGTRMLLYCSITNITTQKEAEKSILQSAEQLRFLNETAHALLSKTDTDAGVHSVLEKVREYFGGTRAYVIEMDYNKKVLNNTYEVCATGVSSEIQNLQNIPFEIAPFWFNTFENKDYLYIENVDTLDESRAEERRILKDQKIDSLIVVSLRREGKLVGFFGVDDPTHNQTHVGHLKAIGDYIVVMIMRRALNAKIENDRQAILGLMNDTPGGFVRMQKRPDNSIVPIYFNEGFCRLVGMSVEELMERYQNDAMVGVYPDDVDTVNEAINQMFKTGEVHSAKYRLQHGDGGYIWTMFFGRVTKDDVGETFINVYYSDLSAQEKHDLDIKEMLPFALKAMMSASSDLAFVKDSNFAYVCCTRSLAQLLGFKNENDLVGKTDYDLFAPEFADHFRTEDIKIIKNGESLVDHEETLPCVDGTIRYCNTSKYLISDSNGNPVGIYGVARDITETREIYAQLKLLTNSIPGGLAMYEVSPDKLRLLYCSDGFYALTGYEKDEYMQLAKDNPLYFVSDNDLPKINTLMQEILNGTTDSFDYVYRARRKDGGYRHLNLRGTVSEKRGNIAIVNVIKFDVTEQHKIQETLRMSEEQYRLALEHSGNIIARYDIADKSVNMTPSVAALFNMPEKVANVPEVPVQLGNVTPETVDDFVEFYQAILRGEKKGNALFCGMTANGWRWFKSGFTTVFSDSGNPVFAVVVFEDVTEEYSERQAVKENQQAWKHIAEHSNRLIYRYDIASRTIVTDYASAAAVHIFDKDDDLPEGIIKKGMVLPESIEDCRRFFRDIFDGKPNGETKAHMCLPGKKPCWVDMKYSLIYSHDKTPKSAVISVMDITGEHEMQLAYDRYLQTIDSDNESGGGIINFEADVTRDITEKRGGSFLPKDCPSAGRARSEIIDYLAERYVNENERKKCREFFARERLITQFSDGLRNLSSEWGVTFDDGKKGYVRAEVQMVRDPYTGHIRAYTIFWDITREKTITLNILKQAELDGMTGVYNKSTAENLIRQRLSQNDGTPCVLIVADLDNLKSINDSFGHTEGDDAIRSMSAALSKQFRKTDIVGRIGGDEFVVFIAGSINEAKLHNTLTALIRRLSMFKIGNKKELSLTTSIGIATGTIGNDTYEELFRKADKALYHVKHNRKNDFAVYVPDMETDVYEYKLRAADIYWQTNFFNNEEINRLLNAISTVYPLVISVNLTQNSYYMMQYANFPTTKGLDAGVFDDLIAEGAQTFHPDDRESFLSAFKREQLLKAHSLGKRMVSHVGKQMGDDGVYHNIRTDVIFVKDNDSDDVIEITLARELSKQDSLPPLKKTPSKKSK